MLTIATVYRSIVIARVFLLTLPIAWLCIGQLAQSPDVMLTWSIPPDSTLSGIITDCHPTSFYFVLALDNMPNDSSGRWPQQSDQSASMNYSGRWHGSGWPCSWPLSPMFIELLPCMRNGSMASIGSCCLVEVTGRMIIIFHPNISGIPALPNALYIFISIQIGDFPILEFIFKKKQLLNLIFRNLYMPRPTI